MKQLLLLLTLITFSWNIASAQIVFDTVEVRTVGPGMKYYKIKTNVPWSIDLFKADIKNQYFRVETVKSLDKLAAGREKTTSMAARRTWNGHWAVAAINGDFFDLTTGMPNSLQVERGEGMRNERVDYPSAGFDTLGHVSISKPVFSAAIKLKDTTLSITNINIARPASGLILYNRFYGGSTGTVNTGTEIIIRIPNGWTVNDTLTGIIDSVGPGKGNTVITPYKAVLSGSGAFAAALNNKAVKGDTVRLIVGHLPSMTKLKEMISGHPLLVVNGAMANIDPTDPFSTTRHPRTAIGINSDTSAFYMITVDGRQATSLGIDLFELADFMLRIGVYQGMNLDGGGSTTMAVRGNIMNSPSDAGGERTVANALLVISTAPQDTLKLIDLQPGSARLFAGTTLQCSVTGTDIHYNPIAINNSLVQFSLSKPSLGSVSNTGLFTAGGIKDSGYIYAAYQGLRDSMMIFVKGVSSIKCEPKQTVTDLSRIVTFKARVFDTDGVEQPVAAQNFQWLSVDTSIGTIDVFGQFKAKRAGTARVVAKYAGFSDTAQVFVQIGFGYSVIDSIESLTGFTLSTLNSDSVNTRISLSSSISSLGTASIKLDYSFTYIPGLYFWAYIAKPAEVYGVPDSILIDVRSDGAPHRIFFDLADQYGATQRAFTNKIANNATAFESIRGVFPKTSTIIYPMSFKNIAVAFGGGTDSGHTYTGTIYLDNIRVKYPTVPSSIAKELSLPRNTLSQNFPNPFNPVTVINYELAALSYVTLKVYDVLGKEVAVVVNEMKNPGRYRVEFDGRKYSSGVYYYTLTAGDSILTRKMLLIK